MKERAKKGRQEGGSEGKVQKASSAISDERGRGPAYKVSVESRWRQDINQVEGRSNEEEARRAMLENRNDPARHSLVQGCLTSLN